MLEVFSANNFILVFQLLYILTALGVVIVVISENRNPLKTIAWVLVLLLLPLVGLIFYYFFGEDHRKQRLISRKMHKRLNRKTLERTELKESLNPPVEYKGLINLLNKVNNCPLYGGNKITFYSDGESKFEALFEEIKKATKHIHLQYYIFMDDKIGHKVKDLLIEKAREGVEVRVLYDAMGAWKSKKKFYKEMEAGGVQVTPFLKVAFPILTSRVNYRNHRKVVVIDGEVGFMGGMNIADRYIEGNGSGIWRDSHFKLEGRAVHGLQTSFVIDWYASRNEFLTSNKYYPQLESKGNNLMQIATSGPTGEFKEIHQGIFQAITNAKEYIYIQTPYLIPTDALMLALQTAALSGVDVRIMIPQNSDTTFVQIASMSFIKDFLESKVKIHLFTAGFLHSKLMVIDDNLTITGSANMDVRSFEHNFEIDAFIYNRETALAAKNIFLDDMQCSDLIALETWNKRPRHKRFAESFLRLFTPLL
ncbi:cardiolipin synthase [Dysgonomonas macrotermitis]|uniref:cardiolipin synthase n=1 Tax=Dysgonomonas macrotermitis TaxID=1346286 RepID=UPI00373FDCF3